MRVGRGTVRTVELAPRGLYPMILIAGPCQIEGRQHAIDHAQRIATICDNLGIPFIYKSSFDKANRTSPESRRGVGIEEGLSILSEVRDIVGCPVLTDVHEPWQCAEAAHYVDVLQIPALLSKQTDLLVAAGKTGLPVNIKKGQFMSPRAVHYAAGKVAFVDMADGVKRAYSTGTGFVMITERGTSFGHGDLVVDFRGLKWMDEVSGCPIIFDATHTVQTPSDGDSASGGYRELVEPLALAAVGAGVAGLFIEVHENPDAAPSDGPCMLALDDLPGLLIKARQIDQIVKGFT